MKKKGECKQTNKVGIRSNNNNNHHTNNNIVGRETIIIKNYEQRGENILAHTKAEEDGTHKKTQGEREKIIKT